MAAMAAMSAGRSHAGAGPHPQAVDAEVRRRDPRTSGDARMHAPVRRGSSRLEPVCTEFLTPSRRWRRSRALDVGPLRTSCERGPTDRERVDVGPSLLLPGSRSVRGKCPRRTGARTCEPTAGRGRRAWPRSIRRDRPPLITGSSATRPSLARPGTHAGASEQRHDGTCPKSHVPEARRQGTARACVIVPEGVRTPGRTRVRAPAADSRGPQSRLHALGICGRLRTRAGRRARAPR